MTSKRATEIANPQYPIVGLTKTVSTATDISAAIIQP